MATYSEVKKGLDDIATTIQNASKTYDRAKAAITAASGDLAAIPMTFSDIIATIDAYAPAGAFETLTKDERAKLATEFTALKTKVDALIATTEFSA
jgi:iron uptake system EfeUOB component EfeO/EfeM